MDESLKKIVYSPFDVNHSSSDINALIQLINSVEVESRIVMEYTGRYYEVLAHQLSEASRLNYCLIIQKNLTKL